jgi:hypothetical protein
MNTTKQISNFTTKYLITVNVYDNTNVHHENQTNIKNTHVLYSSQMELKSLLVI